MFHSRAHFSHVSWSDVWGGRLLDQLVSSSQTGHLHISISYQHIIADCFSQNASYYSIHEVRFYS